ncbi:hypothetical protein [Haladaptatus sp.]
MTPRLHGAAEGIGWGGSWCCAVAEAVFMPLGSCSLSKIKILS